MKALKKILILLVILALVMPLMACRDKETK